VKKTYVCSECGKTVQEECDWLIMWGLCYDCNWEAETRKYLEQKEQKKNRQAEEQKKP
jgi:hypothetical protein